FLHGDAEAARPWLEVLRALVSRKQWAAARPWRPHVVTGVLRRRGPRGDQSREETLPRPRATARGVAFGYRRPRSGGRAPNFCQAYAASWRRGCVIPV